MPRTAATPTGTRTPPHQDRTPGRAHAHQDPHPARRPTRTARPAARTRTRTPRPYASPRPRRSYRQSLLTIRCPTGYSKSRSPRSWKPAFRHTAFDAAFRTDG
ncbi:hypothetical protein SUDANB99_03510 [Streptomyces sp. enrichment culture]